MSSSFTVFSSSDSEGTDLFIAALSTMAQENASQIPRPIIRRIQINRDREAGHDLLMRHYFGPEPLYNEKLFKRRFRMQRPLFERIVNDLEVADTYFQLRWDARGRRGFTPLQKCTSAIRQLAYGSTADLMDDYLQMSDSTSRECLYNFCKNIRRLYGPKYLRKPNYNDVMNLYEHHENYHGFPGMLGSIDCMHWDWENCPVAWRGQFMRGDHGCPSIILEAVCSQDLWIWHAYFGMPGANNDLNVLNSSPLLNDMENGVFPPSSFFCNDNEYAHGYYLADGIYPEWPVFMQTITCPTTFKRKRFQVAQEGARKDIERAFGVLKKRFQIIKNQARAWHPKKIRSVMYACIIIHNMILECEGKSISPFVPDEDEPSSPFEIDDPR
ncbi:hypothetical protein E3N88_04848 [Mikania micrantha]|uniref:DDE Tnp4 domain-containing protein n=1 Tax=Mikania micrantha TaxID=192012 RepID=A0A5N6PYB3_9ASTR|nr:hypothetical protein E3N88_04848 [Mikania micrantha]